MSWILLGRGGGEWLEDGLGCGRSRVDERLRYLGAVGRVKGIRKLSVGESREGLWGGGLFLKEFL